MEMNLNVYFPFFIINSHWRSNGGRVGKDQGPQCRGPEFCAVFLLNNVPVTVKIRTSRYCQALGCFVATLPTDLQILGSGLHENAFGAHADPIAVMREGREGWEGETG